jgi:flagellar hook-length control protein FliK
MSHNLFFDIRSAGAPHARTHDATAGSGGDHRAPGRRFDAIYACVSQQNRSAYTSPHPHNEAKNAAGQALEHGRHDPHAREHPRPDYRHNAPRHDASCAHNRRRDTGDPPSSFARSYRSGRSHTTPRDSHPARQAAQDARARRNSAHTPPAETASRTHERDDTRDPAIAERLKKLAEDADTARKKEIARQLREALLTLGDTLNFSIVDELKDFSLDSLTEKMIDDFAEIVHCLEHIAALLDNAVAENRIITIKGKHFDTARSADAVKTVHTQLFRIKLLMRDMGLSSLVTRLAQEKNPQPPLPQGMLTAVNPRDMGPMSHVHLRQLLSESTAQQHAQITRLYEKALQILQRGHTTGQASTPSQDTQPVQSDHARHSTARGCGGWLFDTHQAQWHRHSIRLGVSFTSGTADGSAGTGQATASTNASAHTTSDAGTTLTAHMQKMSAEILRVDTARTDGTTMLKNLRSFSQEALSAMLHGGTDTGKNQSQELFGHLLSAQKSPQAHFTGLEQSVLQQMGDKMRAALKTGTHEMRIALKPDSLGRVKISIRVEHEIVTARLQVETQQVKQIVESNIHLLRDSLQEHNLKAGQLSVDIGTGGRDHNGQSAHPSEDNAASSHPDSHGDTQDEDADAHGPHLVQGQDTGRRYGTNTVEYFA